MSFPCETRCGRSVVVRLGKRSLWAVCAACAELPRFRRYRSARVIGTGAVLRRDSAGWWVDGELVPPAPLAEVLGRLAKLAGGAP